MWCTADYLALQPATHLPVKMLGASTTRWPPVDRWGRVPLADSGKQPETLVVQPAVRGRWRARDLADVRDQVGRCGRQQTESFPPQGTGDEQKVQVDADVRGRAGPAHAIDVGQLRTTPGPPPAPAAPAAPPLPATPPAAASRSAGAPRRLSPGGKLSMLSRTPSRCPVRSRSPPAPALRRRSAPAASARRTRPTASPEGAERSRSPAA
jgi:hypothetical protein